MLTDVSKYTYSCYLALMYVVGFKLYESNRLICLILMYNDLILTIFYHFNSIKMPRKFKLAKDTGLKGG